MTGVLGAPVPPPPGQWQAALDHAVNAADGDDLLDDLVPDLWAEPGLPPEDPSERHDGTTPDAMVQDSSLSGADDRTGADIGDLSWGDPAGPEQPDDSGDGSGPAPW